MQYQWTDGAQLTGDMSGVAPFGRFDQYPDATVTAVGVGATLERAPANDSSFAMRRVDHSRRLSVLSNKFYLLGIDLQHGDRRDRGLQNLRPVLDSEV